MISQGAHDGTANCRGNIDEQQRQGRGKAARANGSRIRGQIDARQEEAQPLDGVGNLMQHKRLCQRKPQLEGLDVRRGGARQPGLDEEGERHGQDEQRDGPDAQRRAEAVLAQEDLEDQGQREAGQPRARPHDAVGEALAPGEPLVHVQQARAVGDGAADGVEDALRDDEVADVLGEGAGRQRDAHEHEAQHGRPPAEPGVHSLDAHDEGDVEVHDALRAREYLRHVWMGLGDGGGRRTMAQVPMMGICSDPANGSCVL